MTLHLGLWAFPVLATLLALAWAILLPLPKSQGAFDLGALLSVYLRGFVVGLVMVVAWFLWAVVR